MSIIALLLLPRYREVSAYVGYAFIFLSVSVSQRALLPVKSRKGALCSFAEYYEAGPQRPFAPITSARPLAADPPKA